MFQTKTHFMLGHLMQNRLTNIQLISDHGLTLTPHLAISRAA